MDNLVGIKDILPPMTLAGMEKIRELEGLLSQLPQADIGTHHVLHGGMYARSVKVAAGVVLTGALINVPTLLIVSGDAIVTLGDTSVRLTGFNVLAGSRGRKQAFVAVSDIHLTMIFATDAETIEQAEEQFTDEADRLLSRQPGSRNTIVITGE